MARIPQYSSGQVLPMVRPGVRVTGAPSPQEASLPGQNLQQIGQALGAVGDAAGDYAAEQQDKINKVRFNDAYNQALSEANRLKNEYSQMQGAEAVKGIKGQSLKDYYAAEIDKAFSGIASGLTARDLQDGFQLESGNLKAQFLRGVEDWEVSQGQVYADNVRDATVLSAFDQIAEDPMNPAVTGPSLARAKDALTDKLMDAGYDGEALDQQVAQAMGKAHNVIIDRMLSQDDLNGAKAYFEAHKGDYLAIDAKAVPDLFRQKEEQVSRATYENLSLGIQQGAVTKKDLTAAHDAGTIDDGYYASLLGQWDQKVASREAEQKRIEAELQSRNFAALQVGIDDGRYTRADADLAYQKGQISPAQWSQAARQANDRTGKKASADVFLSYVEAGLPIDPTDSDMKKGAEAAFQLGAQQAGLADGKDMFVQDWQGAMQATMNFANQSGIIPETPVTVLRGMKSSGDPGQQMAAIEAISDLYTEYPNATDAAFKADEVAEAISFRHKLDAGIDPQQAYAAILKEREARNEPAGAASLNKMRVAEGRKLAKEFTRKDALSALSKDARGYGGKGGLFGTGLGAKYSGGVLAEQQIVTDFQDAFQTYYVQHGDADLAEKQARATMQRTVGASDVNGGRVMMHPPEKYYPDTGNKNWMRDALVAGVSEAMNADVKSNQIELIADQETSRAVRDGERPSYAVQVKSGATVEVLPDRWTFDAEYAAEEARMRQDADAMKQLTGSRQKAARRAQQVASWAAPQTDAAGWNVISQSEQNAQWSGYLDALKASRKAQVSAEQPTDFEDAEIARVEAILGGQ